MPKYDASREVLDSKYMQGQNLDIHLLLNFTPPKSAMQKMFHIFQTNLLTSIDLFQIRMNLPQRACNFHNTPSIDHLSNVDTAGTIKSLELVKYDSNSIVVFLRRGFRRNGATS